MKHLSKQRGDIIMTMQLISIYHIGHDACGKEALRYAEEKLKKSAYIIAFNMRWPNNTIPKPMESLVCFHCKKPIYITVLENHKHAEARTSKRAAKTIL